MTSYLLAGPAIEPVTVAEAKAFCRVDDAAEDGLIATLIAAARLHVEGLCGRALIAQSWRLVLDCWPPDRMVELPVAPAISLAAVTVYDDADAAHDIELEQFQLEGAAGPARLLLPSSIAGVPILRDRQGIEIDYDAGYGDAAETVPADLRQAVATLVAYWFENRDAAIATGGGTVPLGLDRLLTPYRSFKL